MNRTPVLAACLLAAFPAAAVDVYRCTGPDGATYQDTPCAEGFKQSVMHYRDPTPPPAPPPPAPADDTIPTAARIDDTLATTGADAAPAPAAPATPALPPPDFFLCTATDGSRYISEDGIGRRSQVPYAMVRGGSGQSLGQAYGGPNGIGVSAPELQQRPTIPAAQDPLAGAYVWVVDECHRADPVEACAYLRNELDKLASKLRRAFSDTESQLKQEQARLLERARGC